jgi:hypothetical protein
MIGNYGSLLKFLPQDKPWATKKDKCCFFGTTTGDQDPRANTRIRLCSFAKAHPGELDFKITKIAQMKANCVPYIESLGVLGDPVSVADQMDYKYHLTVDGNTSRFDVWQYMVNNVVLKYESRDALWYHPLLREGEHHIGVRQDSIVDTVKFLSTNHSAACAITARAKALATNLFKPVVHQLFTTTLLVCSSARIIIFLSLTIYFLLGCLYLNRFLNK